MNQPMQHEERRNQNSTDVEPSGPGLRMLAKITEKLNRHLELDGMLDSILPLICDLVGSPSGWLFLKDGHEQFVLASAFGLPPGLATENKANLRWELCRCQRMLLNGELSQAVHIVECQRLQEVPGNILGLSYHASIPLRREGKEIGVLNLAFSARHRPISEDELAALTLVGDALAMAIHRARLFEAVKEAEYKTRRSLMAVLETTTTFVGLVDPDGHFTYLNGALCKVLNLKPGDPVSLKLTEMFPRSEQVRLNEHGLKEVLKGGAWSGETVLLSRSGQEVPVLMSVTAHRGTDGETEFISFFAYDMTEAKKLQQEQRRLLAIIEEAPEFIATADVEGQVHYYNRAARKMLGIGEHEDISKVRISHTHPDWANEIVLKKALPTAAREGVWTGETALRSRHGDEIPVLQTIVAHRNDEGLVDYFSTIAVDISQRKRYEAQLTRMATHDSLTGLLNRYGFQSELERHLSFTTHYSSEGVLLYLDLDNFKDINDILGHHIGDDLLRKFAATLVQLFGEEDVIGRLGGDEFGVIMPHSTVQEAREVALKLLANIEGLSVSVKEGQIRPTASIGIAAYPQHGNSVEDLLINGDLAMYESKYAGGGRVSIFSPNLKVGKQIVARVAWSQRIRQALVEDRFKLYWQPIYGVDSRKIEFHEVLLRMQEPDGRIIGPNVFLYVAARSELMQEIDRWVVQEALSVMGKAARAGSPMKLSINLSGRAFSDERVIAGIREQLKRSNVDPTHLMFEITEQVAIENLPLAQKHILELQAMGCRFALDDFGMGFASFDLLRHLPVNCLKIDGSFIQNLARNEVDQRLVKAMVEVAGGLGMQTVAEFVGDQHTLELLARYGIDFAQGYYLGHPEPVPMEFSL